MLPHYRQVGVEVQVLLASVNTYFWEGVGVQVSY